MTPISASIPILTKKEKQEIQLSKQRLNQLFKCLTISTPVIIKKEKNKIYDNTHNISH